MSIRCLGCMKLKEKSPVCEHCGYNENVPNYAHQLPIGTVLHGQYTVGKVLGQGGFGITYIGWDDALEAPVAIKEYYPNSFVTRECTVSTALSCTSREMEELFHHNRDRFLREARMLARLQDVPGIVRVHNLFRENNTAYIVMEYVEGIDLKRYIRTLGRTLTVGETLAVLRPVMDALSLVHQAELVHRDISPDNIMIRPDGSAKLLDFGAVREVGDAQIEKNLSRSTESILKHGYAPIEQYQRRGNLGPWTDVYALCATVYFCLTQETPPDAPERMIEFAEVEWDKVPGLTEAQAAVFAKGMGLLPQDRYLSVEELRNALFPEPKPEPKPTPKPLPVPEPEQEVSTTVSYVTDATAISKIEERKQEENPPAPKAAHIPREQKPQKPRVKAPPAPKKKQESSIHKILIPVLAVIAVMLTVLLLVSGGEKNDVQLAGQETEGRAEMETAALLGFDPLPAEVFLPEIDAAKCIYCTSTYESDYCPDHDSYTYAVRSQDSIMQIDSEDLTITVVDGKHVTATVSGLNILERYPKESDEGTYAFSWELVLSGEGCYSLNVSSYADNPVERFDEMDVWLCNMDEDDYGTVMVENIRMEHTGESITWYYTVPETHPFDFTKLKQVSFRHRTLVDVGSYFLIDDTIVPSVYRVYNPDTGAERQRISAYMPAENPTYAQDAWKKNVMMERPFSQYNIYSIVTSVTFLDTIAQVPEDSWDVSKNQDGSVLAWIQRNGNERDLYIGAEGGINGEGSCQYLFYLMSHLTSIHNFEFFHTDNVKSMGGMFSGCSSLRAVDLSSFDTSKVTDMSYMFYDCSSLTELALSSFDTSSVTSMQYIFGGCSGLTGLDLHKFDTSNVELMDGMFKDCSNLKTVDLSSFQTSKVRQLSELFSGCSSLTELDLSHFDTSNVFYLTAMFKGCTNLTRLNLDGWKTNRFHHVNEMFLNCPNLEELDLSGWNISSIGERSFFMDEDKTITLDSFTSLPWRYLFTDERPAANAWEENLIQTSLPRYYFLYTDGEISAVTFLDTLADAPADTMDLSAGQNRRVLAWITNDNGKIHLYIAAEGGINAGSNPSACNSMFSGWDNLQTVSFNGVLHTDYVTNMSYMFWGCKKLEDVDLHNLNTSKVTDMKYMFTGCDSLTALDLSSFDTSNVRNMSYMFSSCSKLTTLDLSSFDTSNVTDMSSMFEYCYELVNLNVSHFNTAKVTNMQRMFDNCYALRNLKLDNWDVSKVTNYDRFLRDEQTISGQPWEEFFEK